MSSRRTIADYVAAVRVEDVSRTCEVLLDPQARAEAGNFCDAPTTHWYPAMGGGAVALCWWHAKAQLKHRNGEDIGLTALSSTLPSTPLGAGRRR